MFVLNSNHAKFQDIQNNTKTLRYTPFNMAQSVTIALLTVIISLKEQLVFRYWLRATV